MSLYEWTVDLPADSLLMLNDLVRMGIIQLVVQFLFFVVNPAENPFFSTMFLQTIGFVLMGVLTYWLIVRNLFSFKSSQQNSLQDANVVSQQKETEDEEHNVVSPFDSEQPMETTITTQSNIISTPTSITSPQPVTSDVKVARKHTPSPSTKINDQQPTKV